MADERITTIDTPSDGSGPVHHTTIIHDGEARRGGSPGWFVGIVILLALIAGIYLFTSLSSSETAKDNAIANAANEVGAAANKAGTAVEQAGNAAQDAVDGAEK